MPGTGCEAPGTCITRHSLGGALALLYGLAFANLGIIARQRVVVLPFLMSLLAIPRVPLLEAPTPEGGDPDEGTDEHERVVS